MTLYYLFILLAWIGGSITGYLVAQYHNNKAKPSGKTKVSTQERSRRAYLFAQGVMDMIKEGKFLNIPHDELFGKHSNLFSDIDVYRRLFEGNNLGDKKPSEIDKFRDQMFNIHTEIEHYELLFKVAVNINTYSYHYYGNSLYKELWEKANSKRKRGIIKNYTAYKKSFVYRLYDNVPCYAYKFKIYKEDKSGILFMNVTDVPIDGFRVTAFIITSEYHQFRSNK